MTRMKTSNVKPDIAEILNELGKQTVQIIQMELNKKGKSWTYGQVYNALKMMESVGEVRKMTERVNGSSIRLYELTPLYSVNDHKMTIRDTIKSYDVKNNRSPDNTLSSEVVNAVDKALDQSAKVKVAPTTSNITAPKTIPTTAAKKTITFAEALEELYKNGAVVQSCSSDKVYRVNKGVLQICGNGSATGFSEVEMAGKWMIASETLMCPHCGSKAVVKNERREHNTFYWVECSDTLLCGAKTGQSISLSTAVEKWNKRSH